METSDILFRVRATGVVTADDALTARQSVYGDDGAISREELTQLFRIDEAARVAGPAWIMLLSEAAADFIVHQKDPSGYVSQANADWLTGEIAAGGKVKTARELEVLVKVLETATTAPKDLINFALKQVQMAVIDGAGPLAAGGEAPRGRVTKGEVDLLRRILYAVAGDGNIGVSRAEAEVLFDINDATAGADNDPAWTDLFVKAITNCIMAAHGYAAPSREKALADERWLDQPTGGIGGFFSTIAAGGLGGVLRSYTMRSGEQELAAMNATEAAAEKAAEVVTESEAEWLAARIGRDGRLQENEKAVLRRIRAEAPEVPSSLKPLVDQAA